MGYAGAGARHAPALASRGLGLGYHGRPAYESYLTKVRQSMTGTVGYTFALVGIVVAGGVLIFGGDLNGFVRTLLLIVLVASMLVGANSVLSSITGGGAVITGTASPALAG